MSDTTVENTEQNVFRQMSIFVYNLLEIQHFKFVSATKLMEKLAQAALAVAKVSEESQRSRLEEELAQAKARYSGAKEDLDKIKIDSDASISGMIEKLNMPEDKKGDLFSALSALTHGKSEEQIEAIMRESLGAEYADGMVSQQRDGEDIIKDDAADQEMEKFDENDIKGREGRKEDDDETKTRSPLLSKPDIQSLGAINKKMGAIVKALKEITAEIEILIDEIDAFIFSQEQKQKPAVDKPKNTENADAQPLTGEDNTQRQEGESPDIDNEENEEKISGGLFDEDEPTVMDDTDATITPPKPE